MPPNTEVEPGVSEGTWLRNSALGAASSWLATLLTFPVHKTIFRQQIHGFVIRQAVSQLYQEGLLQFYRGILPPLLSKTIQGTLLYGSYDSLMPVLFPQEPVSYQRSTAGCLAGAIEALVLTPFERIQNVLQDHRKVAKLPHVQSILKEFYSYGLKGSLQLGYYRGFLPVLLRNSTGSALYFTFKDPIKNSLSDQGLPVGISAFVSGSVNGVAICLALYPLSVLVANVQSQVGAGTQSLRTSAQNLWASRSGKLLYVYRGSSLIVLRSCLSWGITTAIYELLRGGNNH
ncbi:solute carrier family 25 member 53 [Callorhinchus milii]|uniref:solute carrier family 25 member 53 n=1 Tax=Callorhinchus milii TaxID=7868 RepID=UPI00045719D4|nr:solute carrier family 25 member 53 [Callorhinchus milii]|eukprot:gi/632935210/ref/XP_007889236.1/ PREDICTED: solute carrier family 25 member 53 [Callorhinchus milii]